MNLFKHALNSVTTSVNSAVTRMQCYPDEVMCANGQCKAMIPVPYFAFSWFCRNKHFNDVNDEACTECGEQKSASVPKDKKYVTSCPFCGTTTNLPTNNFTASISASVRNAPETAKNAYANTLKGAKEMVNVPKTFPCQHCCGTLNSPQGVWTCSCGQGNEAHASKCAKCNTYRFAEGVACSICNKTTQVPQFGIQASLKSGVHSMQTSVDAVRNISENIAYVKCVGCSFVLTNPNPNPNERVYLTCMRCNTAATYNDADKFAYNAGSFVVPPHNAALKATGPCSCCATEASRVCMVCQKGACSTHSGYIRRHPTQTDLNKQPVCKTCVVAYDTHFMPDFIMAAHPLYEQMRAQQAPPQQHQQPQHQQYEQQAPPPPQHQQPQHQQYEQQAPPPQHQQYEQQAPPPQQQHQQYEQQAPPQQQYEQQAPPQHYQQPPQQQYEQQAPPQHYDAPPQQQY